MRILAAFSLLGLLVAWAPAVAQRGTTPEDPVVVALRRPAATGILVIDVEPDSPAHKGGLAPGDILSSYNDREVTTIEQLEQRLRDSRNLREVTAVVYRGKEAFSASIETGPLGIDGRAVTKGRGTQPFHPATRMQPDLSVFSQPDETWREFFLGPAKVGFSRERRSPDGEFLRLESRLRALGGGQEIDLAITAVFRRQGLLELESLTVARRGQPVAEGRRQGEEWVGKLNSREVRFRLPGTTMPNVAVGEVARILPQKRGACVHFTRLEETEMRLVRGCELYCASEDTLALPGGTVRAWRFEQYRYGELGYTYWVAGDRRLVRAHYGGPSDQLCSREKALSGLPAEFAPD